MPSASSRPIGGLSVGRKLSSATLVVVVLVAAAVYIGLSRYERRSLILAKEQAAIMVMQLLAANLSAPLTFDDATSVGETVASLASNPEIEFGAAWAVDPAHPAVLAAPLSVLSRGPRPIARPASVPAAIGGRFTGTEVVVEAPVKDPNGKVVGVAQLAFSTAREETLIADIERRVLWLSMGSALGLIGILSLASRAVVVRPLQRLTQATSALERGDKADLVVTTRDEIGDLMRAFLTMSAAIETREHRIRERNRDMRRILDNAEGGFITVSRAGVMSDERSRILEGWFGPAEGPSFLDYFSRICPDLAEQMQVSWEALGEGTLPMDLLIDQMPRGFVRDGRHFELRYRAISGPNDAFESLLVVIHDATEGVERDRAERAQKEMLAIFQRLMTDPSGWREFLESGSRMVERLSHASPPDDVTARRLLHTLKGNCAVMGIEGMARFIHELEGRLAEDHAGFGATDARMLAQRWGEVAAISAGLGGGRQSRKITITAEELDDLVLALERRADVGGLARRVASWRDEPIAERFEGIRTQVQALSHKLGKGEPDVIIEPGAVRVPFAPFADLWATLTHVVRNAVDHGFQTAAERTAAGKGPNNRLWLRAVDTGEQGFVLSISDDGRGIDWGNLAVKAAAAGLPTATRLDLERALFVDAISTRDQVSETSGRGVGLGAVRGAVLGLGGTIEIESTVGQGTSFRFVLPWPRTRPDPGLGGFGFGQGPVPRANAAGIGGTGPARDPDSGPVAVSPITSGGGSV
jgi:HAMP domain-containing protein/HPt (histidine-containing phosphotransfer) domain-containing protein